MRDEQLDRLLDEALASYSSREPRPGLENRVLARVRAEGGRRRIPRWVFAVPVLACLVLVAIIFRPVPPPTPKLAMRTEIRSAVLGVPAKPRAVPRAARRSLPKRRVFPTPAPLTTEERALLAFIRRSPEQARELFSPPQETNMEPIRIEEIHIERLDIDELQ